MAIDAANARKYAKLGMPLGTARNRLVKSLLLHFASKLEMDSCFRCSHKIESTAEFTIEHKRDWLYGDVGDYFDIENIAFSHRGCNSAAANHGPNSPGKKQRILCAEGNLWCCRCKEEVPEDRFGRDRGRWDGMSRICKSCKAQKNKEQRCRPRADRFAFVAQW